MEASATDLKAELERLKQKNAELEMRVLELSGELEAVKGVCDANGVCYSGALAARQDRCASAQRSRAPLLTRRDQGCAAVVVRQILGSLGQDSARQLASVVLDYALSSGIVLRIGAGGWVLPSPQPRPFGRY